MSRVRRVSLLLVCTTGLGLLAPSVRLGPRGVRSAEQVLPNNNVGPASYWPPHRFLAAREARLPVLPTGFFPPYLSAFAFSLVYYPLFLAYVWYFKPGPIIQAAGAVFGLVTNVIYGEVSRRKNDREERRRKDDEPESRARRYLNRVYAPPPAGPWAGPTSRPETVVADFVEKNSYRKALVLVDESGNVKPELLDDKFRGRMRVLAPPMTRLSLADDVSSTFELDKVMGLEAIARLVAEVIVPPPNLKVPPEPLPVIAIINVPSKATKDDVTNVLTDVATLKSIAGKDIIPIVCLERPDYGLDQLRLNLASFQIEDIKI